MQLYQISQSLFLVRQRVMLLIFNYLACFIGFVALAKASLAIFTLLRVALTRLNSSWAQPYGRKSWALVTGCTEGIGKGFCFELAALDFNLVLVSRNQKKLQSLCAQLWKSYPNLHLVSVKADFSEGSIDLYDKIYGKIKGLDLSILVNNVGISHIKKFDQFSTHEIDQLLNVNIKSMTYLTHRIIPMFLERKDKKCGIINLSSQSTSFSLRNLSVYTATKAYNDHFSRCLTEDYKDRIDILDCLPAIVSTAGTGYKDDPLSCTSEQCARWSLKALGKVTSTAGYWTHTVQLWIVSLLGEHVARYFANIKLNDVTINKKQ